MIGYGTRCCYVNTIDMDVVSNCIDINLGEIFIIVTICNAHMYTMLNLD